LSILFFNFSVFLSYLKFYHLFKNSLNKNSLSVTPENSISALGKLREEGTRLRPFLLVIVSSKVTVPFKIKIS